MPRAADVAYFNHRPGHAEDWKEAAACAHVDTRHPWYATGRDSRMARTIGKAICFELCPVREQCLTYALVARIDHGTWGGLDEQERRRLPRSERVVIINKCRMTPYRAVGLRPQEVHMVMVMAKVNFVPELSPGMIGEVPDALARAAVRNGYAELIGVPANYDDWMYRRAELVMVTHSESKAARKPHKPAKRKPKVRPGSPATKGVAVTEPLEGTA